jgi:HlyD family secretion protein
MPDTVASVVDEPAAAAPKPIPMPTAQPGRRGAWIVGLLVVAAAGLGAYAYLAGGRHASGSDSSTAQQSGEDHGRSSATGSDEQGYASHVEVAKPHKGGLERTTQMPGSVHAFDHADLYAKVSGYLEVQNVDIGSVVKRGDVLAEIYDPEIFSAVDQAAAALEQAKAKVIVSLAMIKTAEARLQSAKAEVSQAEIGVKTKEVNRVLQQKKLARITGLVARDAIEAKLQDEQTDQYGVAVSEKSYAEAEVVTAKAEVEAKKALIEQAKADHKEAEANVKVAEADLKKAKELAAYAKITSPYDGIVTLRSYHRGDFIRSATDGEGKPLLSVARTDLMRIVVPVPDRDVPFVEKGDEAIVRMDALGGREFKGSVARASFSEDPESRNMRTEIDLENKDGKLRDGMWGRVTIILDPPSPSCVTIPSSALLDQNSHGEGFVYVVRDGKVKKLAVRIGKDDGLESEILDGLQPDDEIVVRYNGALRDGATVTATPIQESKSAEHD